MTEDTDGATSNLEVGWKRLWGNMHDSAFFDDAKREGESARHFLAASMGPILLAAFPGASLGAALALTVDATPAAAQPNTSYSYYMEPGLGESALNTAGCYESGVSTPLLILDFGAQEYVGTGTGGSPDGWGAESTVDGAILPDYGTASETVEGDYKYFTNGFEYCNPSEYPFIGLGTNNDGPTVTSGTGEVWGSVTENLSTVYSTSELHVTAANDLELAWSTYAAAAQWIAGYVDIVGGGGIYFDYGDAQGCNSSGCSGDGAWTLQDVADIAGLSSDSRAVPEIYNYGSVHASTLAAEWEAINHAYPITFYGVMETPPQSVGSGWDALNSATGQSPVFLTRIQDV